MSAHTQHHRKSKGRKPTNPYAERGLDQFALVSAELHEAREKLASKLGTSLSLVRFASTSDQNKWVPIIVPRTSTSPAETRDFRTASAVLMRMHGTDAEVNESSSPLQSTFQQNSVITDDYLQAMASASASLTDVRTIKTEMPSTFPLVLALTTAGNKPDKVASAPATPRASLLQATEFLPTAKALHSRRKTHHALDTAPSKPRASLLQDTEFVSPKAPHSRRKTHHALDIKEGNNPMPELGLGSTASSAGPSMETLFNITSWHVPPEKLGQALMVAGLVFILSGLLKGYFPAIVGVVCWWYVLPSMRQAIGDKPFVRSHHLHQQSSHEDGIDVKTGIKAKERRVSRVLSSGKDGMLSCEHKKKVTMDGLLERRQRKTHV